jgi:hypothetical protein
MARLKAVPFVAAHNAYHFGRIVLFGRSVTDIPVAEFCGAPFGFVLALMGLRPAC